MNGRKSKAQCARGKKMGPVAAAVLLLSLLICVPLVHAQAYDPAEADGGPAAAAPAVCESLHVYKAIAGGGPEFLSKYAVGPNQELTFELVTSEAELEIEGVTVNGSPCAIQTPASVAGCDGKTVHTVVAELPGTGQSGPIGFTVATDKGDITHDSGCYNAGAGQQPVEFLMPGGDYALGIESEDTVLVPGGTIYLTFESTLDILIQSVDMKDLKGITAFTPHMADGYIELALSAGKSEGFDEGEAVTASVHAIDRAGNDITLVLAGSDSRPYRDLDSQPPQGNIALTLDKAFLYKDDGGYYIQNEDTLEFKLQVPRTSATNKYKSFRLEIGGKSYDMYRTNGPYESPGLYSAKVGVKDAAASAGWGDGRPVSVSLYASRRQGWVTQEVRVTFESADGLDTKPLTYLKDFKFTQVLVNDLAPLEKLPQGYGHPLPEVIVCDGDKVKMTLVTTHAVTADENFELKVGGLAARPAKDMPDDGTAAGAYYEVGPGGKTISLDIYMSHGGQAGDKRVLMDVQSGGKDEDHIYITLSCERPAGRRAHTDTTGLPAQAASLDGEQFNILTYWSPLTAAPGIDIAGTDPAEYIYDTVDEASPHLIVRDGDNLELHFTANHDIVLEPEEGGTGPITTTLSVGRTGGGEVVNAVWACADGRYYTNFTVGGAPLNSVPDQAVMRFGMAITDRRGQVLRFRAGQGGDSIAWPIYYAPLEVSEITVTSSNRKNASLYCKDEDTVTVSFTTNHYVMLDASIIEKPVTVDNPADRTKTAYSFTYQLQNGDMKDLAFVSFAFSVKDYAGDMFEYTSESPGVTNRLKYYAPLAVTAGVKSDNARPEYAKNGDTVTVSTAASHEAQTLGFRIGGREIGDNINYRENPAVSYRIPDNEAELYEGDIFFSLRVEDPAGNYILVSGADGGGQGRETVAAAGKVIYDRTAPEVRIMPGFNGFTNEDISLSFLYSDRYLDLGTVSCVLNGGENLLPPGGTDTSYTHTVELAAEGDYVVSAVAKDMAGNEMQFAAVCSLIIDKTKPVINMQLGRNTFKTGFTLDAITSIEEDNLSSVLCTVTDGAGVYDWALDTPFDREGRKTVQILLRDMAGNTSVPMVYDIFIDATAPQPRVVNAAGGEALQTDGENLFAGTSAGLEISLAHIYMGDEAPDKFTALKLLDENGGVVQDLLAEPSESGAYGCSLPGFGRYTLLVEAADDVGNETGPLLYAIEFREQFILESLLQNSPLRDVPLINGVNNVLFFTICGVLLVLISGTVVLAVRLRRKKKAYMAQEYIIVDDE